MRAAIFIDGAYLLSQFKYHRLNVDYRQLSDYLLSPLRKSIPLDLLRCYYYYCAPWMSSEPTEDEERRKESYDLFTNELNSIDRWAIRLGKLQKRHDGQKEYFEQKRVDVLLSCDMVRHAAAGHIQHAILVAGDSDFIPAVQATQESGVTLTLWCGEHHTVHKDLVEMADEVHRFEWGKIPRKKDADKSEAKAARSTPASIRGRHKKPTPKPAKTVEEVAAAPLEKATTITSKIASRIRKMANR